MLRALIFDVDGTLADTEEWHRQAFNAAFSELGLDWQWSPQQYRQLLDVSGGKERLGHFIASLPLAPDARRGLLESVPMLHAVKTRIYKELIESGHLPFRPGVLRLLAAARARGLKIAIATTTTQDNVDALLDAAPGGRRAHAFDAIGAGDMVEHKKPAPDIYNLVLGTLRVPRHECVAFEDSVNGLRAAKAAGLFTIVTPTQWNHDHDFSGADLILPHLGDDAHPLDAGSSGNIGNTLDLNTIESLLRKSAAATHPANSIII